MKKLSIVLMVATLLILLPLQSFAATLIPVGQVIGLDLSGLEVTAADESAQRCGVEVGDRLIAIDDIPIQSISHLQELTQKDVLKLTVQRSGETHHLTLSPQTTPEGKRMGLTLRRSLTGIGTVTWYDPDSGNFGALGHGVSTADGKLMPMTCGSACKAKVLSVTPGKQGKPGQLQGAPEDTTPIATLTKNTAQGVFGTATVPFPGTPTETAPSSEIHPGPAKILSTVSGTTPQEYDVEIVKIYAANRNPQRNLLLKITDPNLLQTTGGIVQGMSGSPIIQDGKLVGAVTHVLVNDPTTGYGIFIENMLDAAA